MLIKPSDLGLEPSRLRDIYTQGDIEESLKILRSQGSMGGYSRYYGLGDADTSTKDPANMDVFSREYMSGLADNIAPSAANVASGFWSMLSSPVESAKAIYEAGPSGIMSGMAERYGTPSEWAGGDFSDIKRTAYQDPSGLALEVLPGAGIAGKVAAQVGGKTGMITTRMANQISKASSTFGNPIEALARATAIKGGKALASGIGTTGLIMLDFTTGMPVQSLKAMYAAGRLSGKQRAAAGTSFYKNIFGDFKVQDKTNPANNAKLRNGGMPDDISIDDVLESQGAILNELDTQTPYRLFRDAQTDLGGFQDEARIFGHIQDLENRYSDLLTANSENIKNVITSDLGKTPGALINVHNNIKQNLIADLKKMDIEVEGLSPNLTLDPDIPLRLKHKVGFRVDKNAGFEDFDQYIKDFISADLFDPEVLTSYLTGFAREKMTRLDFHSVGDFKTNFSNAVSPMSSISASLYTSVRKAINEGMDSVDAASDAVIKRRAGLNKILDTQEELAVINSRLRNDFAAYRVGDKSKDEAISAYVSAIENDVLKKGFIDEVEALTGDAMAAPIAGLIARRVPPKSLVARGSAVSAAQAAIVGGAAMINPAMLLFIPFTSPKIVGTILSTLGLKQRFSDYLTAVSRAMHQHPIGRTLGDSPNFIFSMYTALDHIQRYNQQQKEQ